MMMPVADPDNHRGIGAAKLGCPPAGDAAHCHMLAAMAMAGAALGGNDDEFAADMRFQEFIYALSRNALFAPALETNLTRTPRVVGEMLVRDVWDPDVRVLRECQRGSKPARALVRSHVKQVAGSEGKRLRSA